MTVSAADVAPWGKFKLPDVAAELSMLERAVAATLEYLGSHYYVSDPMTDTEELAAIMQCARWWARRNTPEGRSAFGGDIAVTITQMDPDVHAMLTPRSGLA